MMRPTRTADAGRDRVGPAPGTGSAVPPSYPSGGDGGIEVLAFSPGSGGLGGLLACGGHDRMIRIMELVPEQAAPAITHGAGASVTPRLRLLQRCCCKGHGSTVTHLDWSADGTMLMSNCAAHEILIWVASTGKRLAQPGRALATTEWASWTCYLGFPAMGIWPEAANSTDINACHLSDDGDLLLTSDDSGSLKLFNAPCVVEGAPFNEGTGHCSAITCARFLKGDRAAVSSGGADRAVILWALKQCGSAPSRAAALPDQPHRRCWLAMPSGQEERRLT
jgi:WD40 repeat protein